MVKNKKMLGTTELAEHFGKSTGRMRQILNDISKEDIEKLGIEKMGRYWLIPKTSLNKPPFSELKEGRSTFKK